MSLYLGNNLISGSKPINLGVRNIGEVFPALLPVTDAGAHLLDGSLILGGGIYQEFVDYIANLYTDNPNANYFTTEALWQQSVTTYGSCGKFVYDSTNNTVRLPKVSDILQGTTDVTALGDLVKAGLPNITGSAHFNIEIDGSSNFIDSASGAFTRSSVTTNYRNFNGGVANTDNFRTLNLDASRSSSLYKNNFNKVQPQTIKVLYYIVIANSTKTEIQSDIDEIATDLNGKADVDLTNINNVGYIKMAGAGMPSNTYVDLAVGASGSTYTAPADGYFTMNLLKPNAGQVILICGSNSIGTSRYVAAANNSFVINLPAAKGDIVKLAYDGSLQGPTTATAYFRFVYAKGSESEAS